MSERTVGELVIREVDEERFYRHASGLTWFPSSTTVLSRVFFRTKDEARAAMQYGRARGIELHNVAQFIQRGWKYEDLEVDPFVRPRAEHLARWFDRSAWQPLSVEQPYISNLYGFGGQPDSVGRFGDSPLHILDIKPPVAPMAGPQLSSYALAVRETMELPYVPGRTALLVSDDGVQPLALDRHETDKNVFLAALSCYNYGVSRKVFT